MARRDNKALAMRSLTGTMKSLGESAASTASALGGLKSNTDVMNKGVHDQLSIFYEPQIAVTYSPGDKRLLVSNQGKTNIVLESLKLWDAPEGVLNRVPAPGTSSYFEIGPMYNILSERTPKGASTTVPTVLRIRTENMKKFKLDSSLFAIWDGDKIAIHTSTNALTPIK